MKKITNWLKSLWQMLTSRQSDSPPQLKVVEQEKNTESGDDKTEVGTSAESAAASEMVNRIIIGDLKAEEEMIRKYHKGLHSMLLRRCKDKALADEVAQETWLIVLHKIRNNKIRQKERLAAYIIQIGRNQLIMTCRRKSREDQTQISDEMLNLVPSTEDLVQSKQHDSNVRDLLNSMTVQRDRDILSRYYLKSESKAEIAESMNLSEAHFDRVLFRARERLKRLFPKDPADEGPEDGPDEGPDEGPEEDSDENPDDDHDDDSNN